MLIRDLSEDSLALILHTCDLTRQPVNAVEISGVPVRRDCKVPDQRRRLTPHALWFDMSKKSALKEAALSDLAWEKSSAQRFPFNHIS